MIFDSDLVADSDEINHDELVITNVNFTQLDTRYDSTTQSIWCWLHPQPRPCLNPTLLNELEQLQCRLRNLYSNHSQRIFKHLIIASRSPEIFNLGGDLNLFISLIRNRDETRLQQYAHRCIQLVHQNMNNLDLPVTLIALIQGQALGGGFECALSCDVIIAERGTRMGFPEILFNLFPGMGAYNLLAKRIGPSLAERIILSGRTYSAEELYEMGVIDILAETGNGDNDVKRYLKHHMRTSNAIEAVKKAGKIANPITEQNLIDIVDIWVEAAMKLNEKDLAKMEKLIHAQNIFNKKITNKNEKRPHVVRQRDWRSNNEIEFPLVTHLGESVLRDRRQHNGCRRSA